MPLFPERVRESPTAMLELPQPLVDAVRRNCHIADARHAGEDTLCIYLLKMRELFRWERGYPLGAALDNEELGRWLTEREQQWADLEEEPFEPLPIGGEPLDPFACDAVNDRLVPQGWVYAGGLGRGGRPHFFLGRLERRERRDGFTALITAEETARDISAPAAMLAGETIFLRRESLRRVLWEKVENWRWNRPDNAMGRAIAAYNFEEDPQGALEAMTGAELPHVFQHEVGEVLAGRLLGPEWEEMLRAVAGTRAELFLRAVRDNLADCLAVLPELAAAPHPPSLHFYIGNLTALRRQLFPRVETAYEAWRRGEGAAALSRAAEAGREHWSDVAVEALAEFGRRGVAGERDLAAHLESRVL